MQFELLFPIIFVVMYKIVFTQWAFVHIDTSYPRFDSFQIGGKSTKFLNTVKANRIQMIALSVRSANNAKNAILFKQLVP